MGGRCGAEALTPNKRFKLPGALVERIALPRRRAFLSADPHDVTVVPPGGDWFCIAVLVSRHLAAGEHVSRAFVWDTTPFAPGVYSAHAAFSAQGVELATQPMTVRLN